MESPWKVVFPQRLSSTEGHLSRKVVSLQRLSSTEDWLSLKVIFHRRSSSIKGCLPSKVISHMLPLSSSSTSMTTSTMFNDIGEPNSCPIRIFLEPNLCTVEKIVIGSWLSYEWKPFYHHTLVDLIFVSTVKSQPPTLPRRGLNFFWTQQMKEMNVQSHMLVLLRTTKISSKFQMKWFKVRWI